MTVYRIQKEWKLQIVDKIEELRKVYVWMKYHGLEIEANEIHKVIDELAQYL